MVESHSNRAVRDRLAVCQRQTEFSRAILPQVAATACTGNVRYTFRARGITTKWRTLEQRGGRRAGGKEEGRAGGREGGREGAEGRQRFQGATSVGREGRANGDDMEGKGEEGERSGEGDRGRLG